MIFKKVAISAAKKAGDVILKLQKKGIRYQMKSVYDIQAEGDLVSEKIIKTDIHRAFPDHRILSEEAGDNEKRSDYLWVIDPIDGTINYSRNRDDYCISIGLEYKKELILGVIYQPSLKRLYVAEKNKDAFLNGKPIRVSSESDFKKMVIGIGYPPYLPVREKALKFLKNNYDQFRAIHIKGSAALEMADVAAGRLDFKCSHMFNYWDFAAGALLVTEAGGKVTDFEGKPIHRNSKNIVASNGAAHRKILKRVKK